MQDVIRGSDSFVTFVFADQTMYFVNEAERNRHRLMVFHLTSSRIGFLSASETVHAFSMVIDSSYIYYSNDNLK